MALSLELANGGYAGRSVRLEPGSACRVGTKMLGIEFPIPDDASLAPEHFVALLTPTGVVDIYPLGGHKIVRRGNWLTAGESTFRITDLEAPIPGTPETPIDQAAQILTGISDLYAMADVSHDAEFKKRLESGDYPAQPIAEGFTETARAGGEPWLIHVTSQATFGGYMIRRAWGQGRLSFLQSKYSFTSLKSFCQRKLVDPSARFHDPRWLRVAMRALPDAESAEWMGPIQAFRLESRFPSRMERWEGTTLQTISLGVAHAAS